MVAFGAMSDLEMKFDTSKTSMQEIRPALDAALAESFPGGMMKSEWQEDTLVLTGPGASGTVVYEEGALVGRAQLKPPASLMKPVIEQKMRSVLEKAASS